MITLERLKNAVANIKADDEWVNDSHTHAWYRGVCEGLDMLIEHFEEVEEEEQKGGAEAGFVAQLLFYPVTEQLFVFNDSQLRRVLAVKKIKKDIDICSNQYYIYIIN